MTSRRGLAALLCAAPFGLAACGEDVGGDGFACTGATCRASFQGTGEQDLSSRLGKGATVEVMAIADAAATVRVAGREATVEQDEPKRIGRFEVTLSSIDGDDVTLRVVRE